MDRRKNSFAVNPGEVFALVNLNPFGAVDAETNIIDNKNITTFTVDVLITCLTNNGAWTQASHLGMPLASEIIIGRPDKNFSMPVNQKTMDSISTGA